MEEIYKLETIEELITYINAVSADKLRPLLLVEFDRLVNYKNIKEWNELVRVCEALRIAGWGDNEPLDRRGLRSHAKSLNTARTAVLSDVEWVRDDFGQIVAEYQAHGGAVVSTSPKVQYTYADPSASGTPNTIRQLSIKYPNNTEITTAYGSEMANALSRPDALKEGTTVHASYTFLGASTNVGVKYEAAGNVAFTLKSGSPTSDGGDIYTGLDRFGQLVETIWKPGTGSTNLVQSSYGRNRFGGVVWRRDYAAGIHVFTNRLNECKSTKSGQFAANYYALLHTSAFLEMFNRT